MSKKYVYGALALLFISGCNGGKKESNFTPITRPDEIIDVEHFDEISFEKMDNYYQQAGVCPETNLNISVQSSEEKSFQVKYHGKNTTRGENQVIIYDIGSSSNCNGWGYEVAVNSDGYVVEIKSLTPIPKNGFVISFHGDANKAFVIKNFKIGQKVEYNDTTITVRSSYYESKNFEMSTISSQHYTDYQKKLLELRNIDYSVKDDISTLCNCYEKAQNSYNAYLNTKDSNELKKYMNYSYHFDELQKIASQKLFSSRVVEARGVWHRPNERTLAQIESFLDLMIETNINAIYIEMDADSYITYTDPRYTIYPILSGKYGEYDDYMSAFIEEAHKRDIEVHAWDKVFKVPREIYQEHPEWQMLYYNNGNYKTKNTGLLFFDPAIEGVKKYVINKIDMFLSKYDFDGYQFDYIRYNAGNETITDSCGYSAEAIKKFGETPTKSNYSAWSSFRRKQVTETVKRATEMIKEKYPYVKTSVSVASDINHARDSILQDWRTWVEEGYIDIVELMAYYFDSSVVQKDTAYLKRISKNKTFNYTGISPINSGLPLLECSRQVEASINGGSHGTMYFAGYNFNNSTGLAPFYKNSVYRLKSVSPHEQFDKVMKAQFSEIMYKYDYIYISNNDATNDQQQKLANELLTIMSLPTKTVDDLNNIKTHLSELKGKINTYGNDIVTLRNTEDIDYLSEILQVHIYQKENKNK